VHTSGGEVPGAGGVPGVGRAGAPRRSALACRGPASVRSRPRVGTPTAAGARSPTAPCPTDRKPERRCPVSLVRSPGEAYVSAQHTATRPKARVPASHVDPRRAIHHQGPPSQGSSPPVGLIGRVRSREVFDRFDRRADRRRSGPVTVVAARSEPHDPAPVRADVAFAIPRRVGHAVVRNTLRRRLRAAIVELDRASPVQPGSYLLIVHPQDPVPAYGPLRDALADALGRLGARGESGP
jgi:ribonuclease P protein component